MHSKKTREYDGSYLETLYNSLTADQLRTALVISSKNKVTPPRNRDDIIASLEETGRPDEELSKILLDIEASTPQKHCLFSKFKQSNNSAEFSIGTKINDNSINESFVFDLTNTVKIDNRETRITFDHLITVNEWVLAKDGETKRLERRKIRHPIIVHLDHKKCISLIFYPGFTQGGATSKEEKISYEDLIENLMHGITRKWGISFYSVPVDKCIKRLSDGESSKAKIIKTDFESQQGKMSISSSFKDRRSVDQYLSDFIDRHIDDKESKHSIRSAVKEAISDTTPNGVTALWTEDNIVSRIKYWEIGAEFLFVWHGAKSAPDKIRKIFYLIASLSEEITNPDIELMIDEIIRKKKDDIFTISDISSQFSINKEETKRAILSSVSAGLVRPVYRIKSRLNIIESENFWTEDLPKLSRLFTTEDGSEIDGAAPENIEVGFRRAYGEKA